MSNYQPKLKCGRTC